MFDAYFNDIEDSYIDEHKIKFPCPVDGSTLQPKNAHHATHVTDVTCNATMLDEAYDLTK